MADEATLVFKAETQDLVTADKRLDDINKTGKETDAVINRIDKSTRELNATSKGTETAVNRIDKSLEEINRDGQGTSSVFDRIDKSFDGVSDSGQRAASTIDRVNASSNKAVDAQKKVQSSMGRTNARVQNAAFQFQDLAVQIEGGVAPSRALSQQIPQLLGGFGAIGAVTGLVAGLGFSLAGDLVDGLFESVTGANNLDDALADLEDTIKITKDGTVLLSDEFSILAAQSKDVAEVQLRARLISATNASNAAFNGLKSTLEDFNSTLGQSSRSIVSQQAAVRELGEEYGLSGENIKELASLTRQAVSSESLTDVVALRDRVNELGIGVAQDSEKFIKLAQSTNEWVASMEKAEKISERLNEGIDDQAGTLARASEEAVKLAEETDKLAERQAKAQEAAAARAEAAAQAAAQAEKDVASRGLEGVRRQMLDREGLIADNAKRQLDIVKKNEELLLISAKESADLGLEIEADKQKKLEALRKKEEESKSNFRTTELTAAGDFLTLIGNISGAENKKQFERNKKLRIAGATISGIAATVDAYRSGAETNIFVGAAYAAIAAAATGAQIAQIKNQQYPGRAIGGQVTDGQAYRVGEFGPETFVPSSSGRIIPTGQDAANDGRMVEVVNNIKVIGGNENAQVTTTTTQQSDRKVIQDIVVDLMRNQSSPARQALQQTSNVVPRGTR